MSRLAYFKNVNPSVGLDATQNQMLNSLSGQIATKADSSTVTAGLAQKADSSAVSTVATALAQEVTDRTNADALKLATSVYNARIVNEAVFFDSVANSIVLQDANGAELDYVALGLVPA